MRQDGYPCQLRSRCAFFTFSSWTIENQALIWLSAISRMIERTVVKVVNMLRFSFNQVFKLTFNFTDMSVFSYKKTNKQIILLTGLEIILNLFCYFPIRMINGISARWMSILGVSYIKYFFKCLIYKGHGKMSVRMGKNSLKICVPF